MSEYRSTGWAAHRDHYAVPVLFNPYTGQPRDVRDVQSDPQGILIVPPGKVEMLASKPTYQQDLQVATPPAAPVHHPAFAFRECEDSQAGSTPPAAQPAPVQEPVGEIGWGGAVNWYKSIPEFGTDLYIGPPAAQPALKPLTDEQITAVANDTYGSTEAWEVEAIRIEFAKAIEAAHGIKENT